MMLEEITTRKHYATFQTTATSVTSNRVNTHLHAAMEHLVHDWLAVNIIKMYTTEP